MQIFVSVCVRESFSLMETCQSRLTAGEGTGEKTSASLLVSVVPPASEQPTEKGREMLDFLSEKRGAVT